MKVEAYKAVDGSLHETEEAMAVANREYWIKEITRLRQPKPPPIPQPGDPDHHYSYEGGHQ